MFTSKRLLNNLLLNRSLYVDLYFSINDYTSSSPYFGWTKFHLRKTMRSGQLNHKPLKLMCVHTKAETDNKFYYLHILNITFPDILWIVTSLFAIEALSLSMNMFVLHNTSRRSI